MDQIHKNQEHFVSNEDMEMELSELEVASMEHDYCMPTVVTTIPSMYNNKSEKISKINWLDKTSNSNNNDVGDENDDQNDDCQVFKPNPEEFVSHTVEIVSTNEHLLQSTNNQVERKRRKSNNTKINPIDSELRKVSELFNAFNKPVSKIPNQRVHFEPYKVALANNNNNPLKRKTFRNCNLIAGRVVISEEELNIFEAIKSQTTMKDFMRILIWKKFQQINNVCNFNITGVNISNKNMGSYTLYAYCNFLSCNTFKVRCMKKKSGMVAVFYKSRKEPLHYENIPVAEQIRGFKKQLYGKASRIQTRGSVVKWNQSQLEANNKTDWKADLQSEVSNDGGNEDSYSDDIEIRDTKSEYLDDEDSYHEKITFYEENEISENCDEEFEHCNENVDENDGDYDHYEVLYVDEEAVHYAEIESNENDDETNAEQIQTKYEEIPEIGFAYEETIETSDRK